MKAHSEYGSVHCAPGMIKRQSGKVINIASMFGVLPAPSGIAYATSKHAMVGYTKTLMIELQDTGVSVHLVCPGFIQTSLFDNATYIGVDKEKLLPDTNSMMTAQEAAQKIQKGIDSDRQWIIFPMYVRILWWVEWIFPFIARRIWIKQWKSFIHKSRSRFWHNICNITQYLNHRFINIIDGALYVRFTTDNYFGLYL